MKVVIILTLFVLYSSQLLFAAPDSIPDVKYTFKARVVRIFKGQKFAERYEAKRQFNHYIERQEFEKAVELMTIKLSTLDSLESDYKMNTAGYLHGLRGYAHFNLRNYKKAMSDVNRTIEILPKWSAAYYFRGLIHYQNGDYQEAVDDHTQAIDDKHRNKRKVDLSYYYARGNAYMALRQYENAMADYTKCIKLNSKWVRPYLNRGSARQALGDKGAFADYEKAIALNPKLINGYASLGMYYYKQKDYDAAIQVIMDGMNHIPDNQYLYYYAGGFYLEKGDNPHAIKHFTKYLEMNRNDTLDMLDNSGNIRPLVGISVAYYNMGDKENSRKYFDQAKEIQPFFDNIMEGIKENVRKCNPFLEKETETLRLMAEEFRNQ
jgi:tetratricopeptide (TPR) repeat protein